PSPIRRRSACRTSSLLLDRADDAVRCREFRLVEQQASCRETVGVAFVKQQACVRETARPRNLGDRGACLSLRGEDLNLRPSGYEPDELPDCSTPRVLVIGRGWG